MPDVKKLITGFLIIAAGASSSALILSNLGSGSAAPSSATAAAPTSSSPFGGNAFANNTNNNANDPASLLGYQPSSTVDAQANDPNNLTNALSGAFLNNIVETNPDGIQTDANGNVTLAQPDNPTVLSQLSEDKAMTSVRVPNWDIEAAEMKLNTTKDSSPAAVASYSAALQNLFDQYFIKTNLQSMASGGNSDSVDPAYVNSQIQGALQAATKIPTPVPVVSFQKSLVKLLVYEKNTLALAENSSDDPVKNSLVIQAEQQKYNLAIQDVRTEMQKLSTLGGFSFGKNQGKQNGAIAFVDSVLGINTAHAIFGIGDITFDPAVFGQWLLKFAEDTALQIVKNALVSLVQKKVLTWVQGSGAPRFVQNWATASVNAYQAAALSALNSQFQCVGTTQLPMLKVLLATPQANSGNNVCANQFNSQLGNNLASLGNRFTNWNNYFALYQPGGNVWGNLITIQDNVSAAANQNSQATQARNVASQGFTGSQVCADGSNPTGQSYGCVASDGSVSYLQPNGSCIAPDVKKLTDNNGLCGNGSYPQIATPGTVTAQGFGVALDTSPKLITAASTIAGLLSSLTSSLLNTLAQAAITYSNQAVAAELSGTGTGGGGGTAVYDSGTPSLTIVAPSSTPSTAGPGVQCNPSVQSLSLGSSGQVTASFYGQGGAIDMACSLNGTCPSSEGSDGSPTYSWSAPGASSFGGGFDSNSPFTATFNATGTYMVSVAASTDNTTASCEVDVTE
jgi:hypothetical protein